MGYTAHWLPALASRAGFVSVVFRSDARTSRTPVFGGGGLKATRNLGLGSISDLLCAFGAGVVGVLRLRQAYAVVVGSCGSVSRAM